MVISALTLVAFYLSWGNLLAYRVAYYFNYFGMVIAHKLLENARPTMITWHLFDLFTILATGLLWFLLGTLVDWCLHRKLPARWRRR